MDTIEKARDKLKTEAKKLESNTNPTVKGIIRCIEEKLKEENVTFAEQILLEHKSLEKCIDIVVERARKTLNNIDGCIDSDVVTGYICDYYAADDKEEVEKEKQKEAERQAKAEKDKLEATAKAAKQNEKVKLSKEPIREVKTNKQSEPPTPVKPKELFEEQSLF